MKLIKPMLLLIFGILLIDSFGARPIALVKYLKGEVRLTNLKDQSSFDASQSKLLEAPIKIQTAAKSKAVLRLFEWEGVIESGENTQLELRKRRYAKKIKSLVMLQSGELYANLSEEAGPHMRFESATTLITLTKARFVFQAGENGASIIVVQNGEVTVYNRPKDATAKVLNGQKCISDENGIRIVDAQQDDLGQFKQNFLELEFENVQTEDNRTLEIDYDTNF